MTVVYSDTDSCLLSSVVLDQTLTMSRVKESLDEMHAMFASTPFSSMIMNIEHQLDAILLLDKTKYCFLSSAGEVIYKGISVVGRDALGIYKDACKIIPSIMFNKSTEAATRDAVAEYMSGIMYEVVEKGLIAREISPSKKFNQIRCYLYKYI